jgi:hypothetical protein
MPDTATSLEGQDAFFLHELERTEAKGDRIDAERTQALLEIFQVDNQDCNNELNQLLFQKERVKNELNDTIGAQWRYGKFDVARTLRRLMRDRWGFSHGMTS